MRASVKLSDFCFGCSAVGGADGVGDEEARDFGAGFASFGFEALAFSTTSTAEGIESGFSVTLPFYGSGKRFGNAYSFGPISNPIHRFPDLAFQGIGMSSSKG